jgi:hypothetical protein
MYQRITAQSVGDSQGVFYEQLCFVKVMAAFE